MAKMDIIVCLYWYSWYRIHGPVQPSVTEICQCITSPYWMLITALVWACLVYKWARLPSGALQSGAP
ncbi:hypothetical protein XENTR_v10010701 [Xenopus tropicalis]|nr:hypothetical protein XENTR_v10010701 [Xenopus tropicalis]